MRLVAAVLDSVGLELFVPVRRYLLCEPKSQNLGDTEPSDDLPLTYIYTV